MQKELAEKLVKVLSAEGFDAGIHEKYKALYTGVTTDARCGAILSAAIKNADQFTGSDFGLGSSDLSIDGFGLQYVIY